MKVIICDSQKDLSIDSKLQNNIFIFSNMFENHYKIYSVILLRAIIIFSMHFLNILIFYCLRYEKSRRILMNLLKGVNK